MVHYQSDVVDLGKSAKFNGGILQTERVHLINDELNKAEQDSPTFILERNDWNFNITMNNAYNLYKECKSKLSGPERAECNAMRDALKRFLAEHPVIEKRRSINTTSSKIHINQLNWKIFKKALEAYEEKVRVLADDHGVGAPASDGYDEDEI